MIGSHHDTSTKIPAVGVGAMIRRGDEILFARRRSGHGSGYYCWPGGGLEFGESLQEGLAREVFEESGLVIVDAQLICVSNIRAYGHHYIDFEFLVDRFEGALESKEIDITGEWRWHKLSDLPQPLFLPCKLALSSLSSGVVINEPDVINV